MGHANCKAVPGPGTYFFTVRLKQPGSDLLTRHIDLLRLSMRLCQFRHPFAIEDAVVLPDCLHTIWTQPPGDHDFTVRWHLIKSTFAQHVPGLGEERRVSAIWQRRFWEHRIDNAADLVECQTMIRQAPVRAGLVDDPRDWPYSTSNRSRPAGASQRPGAVRLRVIDGTG